MTLPDNLLPPCAHSRMAHPITLYAEDLAGLQRRWTVPYSPRRREALRNLLDKWSSWIGALDFDSLTLEDCVDASLLHLHLQSQKANLDREQARFAEMEGLLPFAPDFWRILEDHADHRPLDAAAAAALLHACDTQLEALRDDLQRRLEGGERQGVPSPAAACRAARASEALRKELAAWHDFYRGFDPAFDWWVEKPYAALVGRLTAYEQFLRGTVAGMASDDSLPGDPVGRVELTEDLRLALVPYSPEELLQIASDEMAWCRAEMARAAAEMGCADWRDALERVKEAHVAPGEQPGLIRDLAKEAIAFVEERDLVTIPDLARDGWRMAMMPPEKQKVNPFFLGGETIQISYPAAEMDHSDKRMSLRGNNRHFARATVQHELIPGHYLQSFMGSRYRPHRRLFWTPFWVEGWTLHWEMLLWDLGFPRTPEERMGMLFWRSHRCARVEFSLRFHLGEIDAQECVRILVEEVGHEPENARGEVRRSFGGEYPPLYQAAYLIGGLQVRALHRELVGGGRMTHRAFHDAFLQQNQMPIALLRAALSGARVSPAMLPAWRFMESLR